MTSQSDDFQAAEAELIRRLSDPAELEKFRKTAVDFGLQDTLDFLVNLRAEKAVLQDYQKSMSQTFGKNWSTLPKEMIESITTGNATVMANYTQLEEYATKVLCGLLNKRRQSDSPLMPSLQWNIDSASVISATTSPLAPLSPVGSPTLSPRTSPRSTTNSSNVSPTASATKLQLNPSFSVNASSAKVGEELAAQIRAFLSERHVKCDVSFNTGASHILINCTADATATPNLNLRSFTIPVSSTSTPSIVESSILNLNKHVTVSSPVAIGVDNVSSSGASGSGLRDSKGDLKKKIRERAEKAAQQMQSASPLISAMQAVSNASQASGSNAGSSTTSATTSQPTSLSNSGSGPALPAADTLSVSISTLNKRDRRSIHMLLEATKIQESVEMFTTAAADGDVDTVRDFLTNPLTGPQLLNAPNAKDQNALYSACRNGRLNVVLLLLSEPLISLNFQVSQHGGTYLHAACIGEYKEIVAALLLSGVDTKIKNLFNQTAYDETNNVEIRQLFDLAATPQGREQLLQQYPSLLSVPSRATNTAPTSAPTSRHSSRPSSPRTLSPRGVADNSLPPPTVTVASSPTKSGASGASHASSAIDMFTAGVRARNVELLRSLISSDKALINGHDGKGHTPLYCACEEGFLDVVLLLVESVGININATMPVTGDTALHVASAHNRATILAILLFLGGNPYIKNKRGVCVTKDPNSAGDIKKVIVVYEIQGVAALVTKYPEITRLTKWINSDQELASPRSPRNNNPSDKPLETDRKLVVEEKEKRSHRRSQSKSKKSAVISSAGTQAVVVEKQLARIETAVTMSINEIIFLGDAYEARRDTFCVVKSAESIYARREDDKLIAKTRTRRDSPAPIIEFDEFRFEEQRGRMLRIEVRHPILSPSTQAGKDVLGGSDGNPLTTSTKDLMSKKDKKAPKALAVDENERTDNTGILLACVHSTESCLLVLPLLNLRPIEDEWINLHYPLDTDGIITIKFDYWDSKSLHNITNSADVNPNVTSPRVENPDNSKDGEPQQSILFSVLSYQRLRGTIFARLRYGTFTWQSSHVANATGLGRAQQPTVATPECKVALDLLTRDENGLVPRALVLEVFRRELKTDANGESTLEDNLITQMNVSKALFAFENSGKLIHLDVKESVDFERRSLAGRMRLSVRVDETTLLPSLHYEPLFELLAQNRLQALRLALPHVAREYVLEFAEHLLKIFKKRGQEMALMQHLALAEIEAHCAQVQARGPSRGSHVVFRANSVVTHVIENFIHEEAHSFLALALKEVIEAVVTPSKKRYWCELDPVRLMDVLDETIDEKKVQALQEKNVINLTGFCDQILTSVETAVAVCPPSIRHIFYYIREHLTQKLPENESCRYQAIAGFIWLRFLCVALVAPIEFKILSRERRFTLDKVAMRDLTLIAKVLGKLANGSVFATEISEPFLLRCNPWLLARKDRMKRFLDEMCLSPSLLPSHNVDPIWGKSMAIVTELLTDALNSTAWEQQQQHLIARASQIFAPLPATASSSAAGLLKSPSTNNTPTKSKSAIPLEERVETTTRLTLAQTLAELNSVIEFSQAEIIQREAESRRAQQMQVQQPQNPARSPSVNTNTNASRARFNSASAGGHALQKSPSGKEISQGEDKKEKLARTKSEEKKRLHRASESAARDIPHSHHHSNQNTNTNEASSTSPTMPVSTFWTTDRVVNSPMISPREKLTSSTKDKDERPVFARKEAQAALKAFDNKEKERELSSQPSEGGDLSLEREKMMLLEEAMKGKGS